MVKQLTDDEIMFFSVDLSDWLEKNMDIFNADEITDEGYERLRGFVDQALQPFSNGYINFN
jgi:hypothetical protein